MIIGTPIKITPQVRSFCNQIVEKSTPFYLTVEPDSRSTKLECFPNVEDFVNKNGGSIQYGWRIGEWSGVMLEADFHAIWRSPNGDFRDVTPFDEKQILFLPDNTRVYNGKQISNVMLAISSHPLVHEFIEVQNKMFEERNKGKLAEKHGEVLLSGHLVQRSRNLFIQIYKSTASPNSECFCGSGKKYKKCHKNVI